MTIQTKNNSGQALIEYALLIFIGAVLSLGLVTTLNRILSQGNLTFNAVLERDLRTANFQGNPDQVWEE